jgi:hypothetical protein
MEHDNNITFILSLNNGETIHESANIYKSLEKSVWLTSQDYISENALSITSLSLVNRDNQHFNLPSSGKNPRFASYNTTKPIGYNFFRKVLMNMDGSINPSDSFAVIVAEFEKHFIELWVNENSDVWINHRDK